MHETAHSFGLNHSRTLSQQPGNSDYGDLYDIGSTGGNSPPPVGDIPSYMGVIVADSITKRGTTISGSLSRIVVVKTDPGYAPTPDQPGTGKVVATFCP